MKTYMLLLALWVCFVNVNTLQAQQKDDELAYQILGTWIVKDLDMMLHEEHKNKLEAQKILEIAKNRAVIERKTITNSFAFVFEKENKLLVKIVQDTSHNIKGTWFIKDSVLHIDSDDEPFQAMMGKLKVFFIQNRLYLGLISNVGMPNNAEFYMNCFVFEKGTLQDLDMTSPLINVPEETIYITKKEQFIVHPQKVKCNIESVETCLQIKRNQHEDWEYFASPIAGFEHKTGYEYVIEVEVLINAGNKEGAYKLLRIISKTKKKKIKNK